MNAEATYLQLQKLTNSIPDLGDQNRATPVESFRWLGQVAELVKQLNMGADEAIFRTASQHLGGILHDTNRSTVLAILFRALSAVEARAPLLHRARSSQ